MMLWAAPCSNTVKVIIQLSNKPSILFWNHWKWWLLMKRTSSIYDVWHERLYCGHVRYWGQILSSSYGEDASIIRMKYIYILEIRLSVGYIAHTSKALLGVGPLWDFLAQKQQDTLSPFFWDYSLIHSFPIITLTSPLSCKWTKIMHPFQPTLKGSSKTKLLFGISPTFPFFLLGVPQIFSQSLCSALNTRMGCYYGKQRRPLSTAWRSPLYELGDSLVLLAGLPTFFFSDAIKNSVRSSSRVEGNNFYSIHNHPAVKRIIFLASSSDPYKHLCKNLLSFWLHLACLVHIRVDFKVIFCLAILKPKLPPLSVFVSSSCK